MNHGAVRLTGLPYHGLCPQPVAQPAEMLTASGIYFDLANPLGRWISIGEISKALSQINRFTGHTKFPYSVAQHSVLVAALVPPHLRFAALMHDAHEALVGDMSQPLKTLCPDYKQVEARVQEALAVVFGLRMEDLKHPLVRRADLRALATERRDLMVDQHRRWPILDGIEPVKERIQRWSPERAQEVFLKFFQSRGQMPCG